MPIAFSLKTSPTIYWQVILGSNNRRQIIHAYYSFVSSTLDLLEDDRAFNEAIRIGLFDTDILQRDHDLLEHNLLIDVPYREDTVLQKLLIAQNVILPLSFIASEDFERVRQKNWTFKANNSKYHTMYEKELQRGIKQLGIEELKRRNMAIRDVLSQPGGTIGREELNNLIDTWPARLIFDDNDPLNQKFKRVAIEKVNFESAKKEIGEIFKNRDIDNIVFLTILSPEGFVIEMSMPQELITRKSAVVSYALNLRFPKEAMEFDDPLSSFRLSRINYIPREFEGYQYF